MDDVLGQHARAGAEDGGHPGIGRVAADRALQAAGAETREKATVHAGVLDQAHVAGEAEGQDRLGPEFCRHAL